MLKKLFELAKRPQKKLTRKVLLKVFGYQAFCLLSTLIVMALWPQDAPGTEVFVFMSFGVTAILFAATWEGALGAKDHEPADLLGDNKSENTEGINNCFALGAESKSTLGDPLSAVGLTRTQENKLRYLLEKGGKHSAVTLHVGMPDGSLAEIDSFGRVTWK